jgi:glucose dehydrogenase
MAQTYIGSTLRTGSGTLTDTVDGGFVVVSQTTTVTTVAAGTAVSSTITIPASSQIINFFVDCLTTPVVGGGTATTVPVTIGTAAAGTQYLSATDCISGGRAALTFTAAQLTAMSDVGANQGVVITVDPNGTISTTQGVYRLTVVYAQKV